MDFSQPEEQSVRLKIVKAVLETGRARRLIGTLALVVIGTAAPSVAAGLEEDLGRNEVRIWGAPLVVEAGATVQELALPERLERLGYRRVHRRPAAAGEFFWGHEVFWIYRREHRVRRRRHPAGLVGLRLRAADGRVLGRVEGQEGDVWLEPELLAESFDPRYGRRRLVRFEELPEHLWRAVLAAEDARFFEHRGVDARALARALLRNARAGKVVQGGSTVTQQLVKLRDLSPRRTLGRKASEALRALALEAEHDKEEILGAYLNAVYLGHLGGVAVHGFGAAAEAYFGRSATRLDLGQATLLAALIQGPNRLHPTRHPERALARQRWVLDRLEELGWAPPAELAAARRRGLPALKLRPPETAPAAAYLDWLRERAAEVASRRLDDGRGVVVWSTLDPWLQELAEREVSAALSRLGGRDLSAALVALDATSGDVVAYVGGDPRRPDAFDRGRRARRQPGSTVKPLVLLEAFERCGGQRPLYPAHLVEDGPIAIATSPGPWEPANPDGRYRGPVSLRRALVDSLNPPFVRLARWCGWGAIAERFRRAGLDLPPEPAPAFVLGAVETTPLELSAAYATFAGKLGRRPLPRPYHELRRPDGRRLDRDRPSDRRVASAAAAYLVRDLLTEAGERRAPLPPSLRPFGKTGTSDGGRDAWFVGGAGGLVTAVWIGRDEGGAAGLSGAAAAAPLWRRFMERAAPARLGRPATRPDAVVTHWVEESTGLRVRHSGDGRRQEIFRRGALPPRRGPFWNRRDAPVIR